MGQAFGAKYYESYISHSSLRQKGDKPYMYAYWKRYLKKIIPSGRLLDIGCGLGFFLKTVQGIYDSCGVDISEYAIKEAEKTAVKSKMSIAFATALPFHKNCFDIVTAFDVVEHLENPEIFFQEAARVLKKGGVLLISTPNPTSFGARTKKMRSNDNHHADSAEDRTIWTGWRDGTHKSVLPPLEWARLIKKNGFFVMRQGTDFLWDVPYAVHLPYRMQWVVLVSLTWVLVWLHGLYPWTFGENYICVARKS